MSSESQDGMEIHAGSRADSIASALQCEFCGKTLSCRQSKYKHKKLNCRESAAATANGGNGGGSLARLQSDMADMKRVLMQLASGLQPAGGADGAIAASTGGNPLASMGTTNINIQINNFRAVSVDHIDHETIASLIKRGDLRDALQEMVRLVHYDPAHPENINAYLADVSHENGLYFRGGRWCLKPRDDLAKLVMFNAAQVMNEHNDEPYHREFTKKQTERFDKFYDVIGYQRQPLQDTIVTMANNRNVVETAHPVVVRALVGPPAPTVSLGAGGASPRADSEQNL